MGISARFYAAILGCAALGLAGLVVHQNSLGRRILRDRLEARAESMGEAVGELALPRLRGEGGLDTSSIGAFMNLPGVVAISVLDGRGTPVFERRSGQERFKDFERLSTSYHVLDGERLLGTVRLTLSLRHMERSSMKLLRGGAAVAGATVVALALATGILTGRLGGYLRRFAAALEDGVPDPAGMVPWPFQGSEIDSIATSFKHLHSQLRSEEMARQSLDAQKNELAGMVVHDLKTPLTVIKALLAMLDEPGSGETAEAQRRDQFRLARRSVEQLNSMIDDILQIARLRDARVPVEKRSIRLGEFAGECAQDCGALARHSGRGFKTEFSPAAGSRFVFGNEAILRRVIGNLVMNAVEHSPEGAAITLGLGASASHEGRVALWVHNPGSRIDERHKEHIFDTYFTTSRTRRNIGFGLAFCRVAADWHGAVLAAGSDDAGTTFTLSLAVLDGAQAAGPPSRAP